MTTSRDDELKARESAYKAYRRSNDPVEKLRLFCLSRGQGGIRALSVKFRGMDDNDDRKLPREEFIRGLSSYGVEMSRKEMEEVFNALDKDRSGNINFDEFLQAMRPPMSKARVDVVLDAFESLDLDDSGVITTEDIERRLDLSEHDDVARGKSSSKDTAKRFLKNFEGKDGDNRVTKDEFFDYYSGVSASIDTDEYFIFMVKKAYRLDGDDGGGRGGSNRRGKSGDDDARSGSGGSGRNSRDATPPEEEKKKRGGSKGGKKGRKKQEEDGHWWYGDRVKNEESGRSGGGGRSRRH